MKASAAERRPPSIVGRLVALAVGVGIATTLLHAAVLVLQVRPLADELVRHIRAQVHAVQAALQAVPAAQRDALAAAMSDERLRVTRAAVDDANDEDAPGDPPSPPGAPLVAELRTATGYEVLAHPAPPDADDRPRWSVLVPIDGQTWRLAFTGVAPSPAGATIAVVATLALVALAGLLAQVIGVRSITRPMSKLAAEMMALRHALQPIAEPPGTSMELRGVIRAFNGLVHALRLSAQSRRDLLAGVSHDIRTPLARLQLRVETEGGDVLAQRAEADFAALGRIVDQFLAYAQGQDAVPAGRPMRLQALVVSVVDGYRATGADVRLLVADGTDVDVPDTGVRRALSNLIDNALAHGRGAVEVELRRDHRELSLVVHDRGDGIADDELPQALQPFVRLSRRGAQDGHCGLGLAIVCQVAGQLGGRIVTRPHDGLRWGIGIALPLA